MSYIRIVPVFVEVAKMFPFGENNARVMPPPIPPIPRVAESSLSTPDGVKHLKVLISYCCCLFVLYSDLR